MSRIQWKRGDTFEAQCRYKPTGAPASVADVAIKSQIRNKAGDVVADLALTKNPDQASAETIGRFSLRAESETTAQWVPQSIVYWDIQYTTDSVTSTKTIEIAVVRDETQ